MVLDQLVAFYEGFSTDSIAKLGDIYDENICFKDPLHEINGLASLTRYFDHICNSSVSFEISDVGGINGDKAFLRWRMHYAHPALNKGRELVLEGASFIQGDDKVVFHQDYYDLGAMIYQHLPMLGFVVGKVNNKLRAGA